MSSSGAIAAGVIATLAASLSAACGPQRIRTPEVPGADLILILPDSRGGTTGRSVVSNASGTVELDSAREYTWVSANQPPTAVRDMSESEMRRLFGDVLSTLPPPEQHFTLHFRFESDELTEGSLRLFADIMRAVGKRPAPEVAVTGHTDTTGTLPGNFELGLKRAQMVRNLLVTAGLNDTYIEVFSHGEGDPLVPTTDEALEPRNRRVEITIR